MGLKKKDKPGRVTPKAGSNAPGNAPKGYTPPTPKQYKVSPRWVPVLMFGLFAAGVLVILLNYMPGSPLLPGDSSNWNILIGLGLITGGFVVATQYH